MKKTKLIGFLLECMMLMVVVAAFCANGIAQAGFGDPMFRAGAVACWEGQCYPFDRGEMKLDMAGDYQWDYQYAGIWNQDLGLMKPGLTPLLVGTKGLNIKFVPTGSWDDDGNLSESSLLLADFSDPNSKYYRCGLNRWAVMDGIYHSADALEKPDDYFLSRAIHNVTNVLNKTVVAVFVCPNLPAN